MTNFFVFGVKLKVTLSSKNSGIFVTISILEPWKKLKENKVFKT